MSHEYGDERIAKWLRNNQYHPRSPKHGRASCRYLLDDLLHESDAFSEAADAGELVYQEDSLSDLASPGGTLTSLSARRTAMLPQSILVQSPRALLAKYGSPSTQKA